MRSVKENTFSGPLRACEMVPMAMAMATLGLAMRTVSPRMVAA